MIEGSGVLEELAVVDGLVAIEHGVPQGVDQLPVGTERSITVVDPINGRIAHHESFRPEGSPLTDDTDLVIDDDVVWITDEAGPIAWAVRPGTDDILATVSIPVGARVSVPMGDGTHIALDGSGNILRIELPR